MIFKSIKRNLVLVVFLIYSGCSIDKIKSPIMPVWDVSYTLPLVNRTEIVIDRIKGEKGIFIDSSSQRLLIKFDSTETSTKSIDEIFSDKISFEDDFAIKPQQVDTISFESFVSDDSVFLEEFHLYKGTLDYQIVNYLNRDVSVNVIVPGFKNEITGDTLSFNVKVNPNDSVRKTLDLKNYRYRMTQNPFGGLNNGFYIKGFAKIGAGYSGDSVALKVKLKELGFNYLKGKVKPYRDEIKPKIHALEIDEDLKDMLPKVNVYGAKLILEFNASLNNLEGRLEDFQVVGTFKSSPNKKFLKIKNREKLDTTITLSQSKIEINLDDIAINEFINPIVPDSITYSGKFVINPGYKSVEVTLPDSIRVNSRIVLFSTFQIDSVSRTDTIEVSLYEDVKDQIDRLQEGIITLDVDNGLPMGFTITGYLVDSLNQKLIYFTREKGTGASDDSTFTILSALVNNEGVVVQSSKQQKKISINKEDIQKLKRTKKAILKVLIYTTEGKKVFLQATDKISIKVSSTIGVRVDLGD